MAGGPYREAPVVRERRATLAPIGDVIVDEQLHAGAQFDVFAVRSPEHGALCVKIPTLKRGDQLFASQAHGIQTSLWGGSTRGFAELDESLGAALEAQLLMLEAERIRSTRGAWNHEVVCLGSWAGAHDTRPPPLAERFRPALATRRAPGLSLDRLDRAHARPLFARMLPALWDALVVAPHGDLALANLILDLEAGRFAVIDPGVVLHGQASGPEGGAGGWMDHASVFTTNASAYPLFPPTYDPRVELAFAEHLAVFAAIARGFEGPALPTNLSPEHARAIPALRGARRTTTPRPTLPDVFAMGVLYDRLLADGHPVYGSAPMTPLWTGRFGEVGTPPIVGWIERGARIIPARERGAGVTPAESALADALLANAIRDRAHLVALATAIG